MTASVLQLAQANPGVASTTIAVTATFKGGSYLDVTVTLDTSASQTCSGVSDNGPGLTYSLIDSQNDATNQQAIYRFVSTSPVQITASFTVTGQLSASTGGLGIAVAEVGGSSGYGGKHAINLQATPTTGTDAVTSGLLGTLNAEPALIVAVSMCTANGADNPAGGTGFTVNAATLWGTSTPGGGMAESKRVTALTSVAATATAVANLSHMTSAAVWTEAPIIGVTLRQYGPGRSPTTARFQQFKLSSFVPPPPAPQSLCAEDAWVWDDDDPDPEHWIIDQADSGPVGPNQPPLPVQDEPHYWWEDEYEDPIVETYEWSGPIQPNAPPAPVEDAWNWSEADDYQWEDAPDDDGWIVRNPNQPAPPVEDAWDWSPEDHTDEPPDDDGSNVQNPNQPPLPAEDIQGYDFDDCGDDWEWFVADSAPVGANQPPLPPEDPWDWSEDTGDDDLTDDGANVGIPNQPALVVDDAWDWSEDTGDEDFSDDGYNVQAVSAAPAAQPADDPWDWSEDTGEEDLTDDGSNVQNANLVTLPANTQEDTWNHDEEAVADDWWDCALDDGSNVQNTNTVVTSRFTYLPLLGVS